MKKILALALAAVIVLAFAACSGTDQPANDAPASTAPSEDAVPADDTTPADEEVDEDGSWTRVKESGKFKVGTEGNWVPFVYNDIEDNDKLKGFEVEVAEQVAAKLGLEPEFNVAKSFDGVLAGLDAGRYDICFVGLNKTYLEGFDKLGQTIPYGRLNTVLVTAQDSDITKWEDLEGRLSGNALTGGYGKIAKKYGATLTDCNLDQAMEMLVTHRIDCSVNSEIAIRRYMDAKPDMAVKINQYYEPEDPTELDTIAAVRVADQSFLNHVNGALQELLDEGVIYELAVKYFGNEVADAVPFYAEHVQK